MTKRTRWSDATSDADPVLRAVLRYAQQLEPPPRDIAACAAAVARAEPARKREFRLRPSRRTLSWLGGVALVGAAGVALGMSLTTRVSLPAHVVTAPSASAPRQLRSAAPMTAAQPTPSAQPPAPPAPRVHRAPTLPRAPFGEPLDEVGALSEARQQLRRDPARALSVLGQHAQLFPNSSWAEERAALRIEALLLLGRAAEGQHELDDFSARFPASIYRLRLQSAAARR